MWTNDAGYLTSFSESDPLFVQHAAYEISTKDISKWNMAFSWGNHADKNYITDGNKLWDNEYGFITAGSAELLTNKKSAISIWENDRGYLTAADEKDPKIGTNTTNRLPKWNGSQMVSSVVYENNGNVGIGAESYGSRLYVAGTVKAYAFQRNGALITNINSANIENGNLMINSARSSGQVWTSDGDGRGAWQSVPAAQTFWTAATGGIAYNTGNVASEQQTRSRNWK